MNIFKNLDKAFDNLERTVADTVQQAALSVVDEFPERSRVLDAQKAVIGRETVTSAKSVADTWLHFSLESRKTEWENLKDYLEKQPEDGTHWQQRAKLAESKLLQLCSALLSCPDPVPHLQISASASSKIVELEEQNRQLRLAAESAFKDDEEVKGLLSNFQALETAHRELQEEASWKDAELVRLRASAADVEAARQQQKEQLAELLSIKRALQALRSEYETAQSQLFELSSQREQESSASSQDVDVLLEQLERANTQLRELQRQKDGLAAHLQQQLQQQPDSPSITAVPITSDSPTGLHWARGGSASGREGYWEVQVALREKAVQRLQAEMEASKSAAQEAVQAAQEEAEQLRSKLVQVEEQLREAHEELRRRPSEQDIRELQQRNQALQSVVDVQVESEGWDSPAMADLLRGSAGPTAIQTIVQERNRKLAAELTALKQRLEEKAVEAEQAAEKGRQLLAELSTHKELVRKLEEDLQAAMAGDGTAASSRAAAPPVPSTPPVDIVPLAAAEASSAPAPSPAAATSSSGSGVTAVPMVDIVARQRDRFRQRVGELEEELRRAKEDASKCRARIESVTSDNVTLYEKVRYLERYSGAQRAAGASGSGRVDEAGVALDLLEADKASSRYQCGPFAVEVAAPSREQGRAAGGLRSRMRSACFGVGVEAPSGVRDVEQQYARAYEAQLNPFKAFREGESEQRIKNLGFGDRAVLSGGKLLAGSKVARIFVTVYAGLLHGFIMLLLYYSASPCTSRYATPAHDPSHSHHLHHGAVLSSQGGSSSGVSSSLVLSNSSSSS